MKKKIKYLNSGSQFLKGHYRSIGEEDLKKLQNLTNKEEIKKFRFCLHQNTRDLVQEMVICSKGFVYTRPHKHPKPKSESYHMLLGNMDVYLFSNKGKVIDKINLSCSKFRKKNSRIMYKISSPIFHTMVPNTKWVIWHEVTTGPFIKNSQNFSRFADFSPPYDSSKNQIKLFFEKTLKRKINFNL